MYRKIARQVLGGMVALGVMFSSVYSQASYATWQYSRGIVLNTKSTGANIASGTNIVKFPVLVRLSGKGSNGGNAADSLVFAQASATNGQDIRFSKYDGTPFPYQRHRWDAVNKLAEFWVLADTVFGGDSTSLSSSGYLKMFWGNAAAADTSNGASVFDSSTNGFAGVWHLQDTTDASSSGFTLSSASSSTKPGAVVNPRGGIIGVADTFTGSTWLKVLDSTSAMQNARLNKNFGGPWTMSAWVYLGANATSGGGFTAAGKGNFGYQIGTGYNSNTLNGMDFGSSTDGGWNNWPGPSAATLNNWYHLVAVRNNVGSTPYVCSLYVNGVLSAAAISKSSSSNARNLTKSFKIGAMADDLTRKWIGKIDEVTFSNTPRTHEWVRLSWANQCQPVIGSGVDSLTVKGAVVINVAGPAQLTLPLNGAVDLASSLNMSWIGSSGSTSYEVQVSTNSGFTTTVFDQPGIAPTTTSASVSGLRNSTTYYWKVLATTATTSYWSSVWSFTTALPSPAAPTLALPVSKSVNQPIAVTLSWNSAATATSYDVQVSTDAAWASIAYQQAGLTDVSWVPPTLLNNTTYYWRVQARNANPVPSGYSDPFSFTTVIAPPAAPVLMSPDNNLKEIMGGTVLTLAWNSGTGTQVASYNLQLSTTTDFSGTLLMNQTGLTSSSSVAPAVTVGSTYYWRVQGVNVNPILGAWSSTWSFSATSEDYAGWANNRTITLNTSATGANVKTDQINFPITVRLTSGNAATVFSQAKSDGSDIRFAKMNGTHLAFELNKYDQVNQKASFWVKVDTVFGNSTTQQIKMYWGKSDASATISDASQVFKPSNGFAGVYHFNNRSGNSYPDATGQGRTATADNGAKDTTGVFDNAVVLHCTGTGSSYTAGDSITIAGMFGNPATVTLSAWVRADSLDQYSSTSNWYGTKGRAMIMTMGDNAGLSACGLAGTAIDSLWGGGHYSSSSWFQYAWPSPSLSGKSVRGLPNNTGHAVWHQGWRYISTVLNPNGDNGYSKLYLNGDSVLNTAWPNDPITYTAGTRTVFGKHGNGTVGQKFGGSIYEARFENVARSSDWIQLSYQNQGLNDLLLQIYPLATPALSSPANGVMLMNPATTLAWAPVAGATSTGVQVSTDPFFGTTIISQTGMAAQSLPLSGLAFGTSYYWRTSAVDAGGSSNWSAAWTFSTVPPPDAPVIAAPANNSTNQPIALTLSWTSATTGGAVTSYAVQLSSSSAFASTLSSFSTAGTSQTVTALTKNTAYYWRVQGTGPGGAGVWGGPWKFTTSAPHFVVNYPSSDNNMTVLIKTAINPTFDQVALQSGDEIAAFDSLNQCVGYVVWDGTNQALTVRGDNSQTTPIDGMSSNELLKYRMWSYALNVEENATPTYVHLPDSGVTAESLYVAQGIAKLSGLTGVRAQMPISVVAGWNMKSLNVIPYSDSTFAVFNPGSVSLLDTTFFLFVKNAGGKVFCPSLGTDDIKHVQVGQGYQIYSNKAVSLQVKGVPVDYAHTPIALSGWNMIAYLPQINDSVKHAFAAVTSLVVVKNNAGDVYWPSQNFDGIKVMQVGEGYKVLVTDDASFTYPAPQTSSKAAANGVSKQFLHLPPPQHYGLHAVTADNALIGAAHVLAEGSAVSDGSEVAAFDSKGNLVGSGTVIHGTTAFAVWGDDPMTKDKDGCGASEGLTFKLWTGSNEYPLAFRAANGTNGATYSTDGVLLGNLIVPAGAMIKKFSLSKVYPNPFKGLVRIAFDVPTLNNVSEHQIEINVYDMKGCLVHQVTKGMYKAGHYNLTWNCSHNGSHASDNLASSVYIIRMKAPNFDKRMEIIRVR